VWRQPWLPDENNPYIQTPIPDFNQDMRVSDLIHPLLQDWNMELLNTLLLPRDVSLILKLPVSVHFDDKWCWRGDLRGLYSVKNGYRALSSMVDSTVNVSWKSIWRLKIPPAVHNFLWRCMHKILPVMTVLAARRVDVDTLCPLCRAHPETMDHLLHNCVCVGPLWQIILNGPIPDIGVDCVTWMFDTLSHGDGAQNLRVAAVWWSVWRARNDVVWNGKPWHLMNVVHEVYRNIEAWQNLGSASLAVDTYSHAWQSRAANSEDEVRIFVDAAVFSNPERAFFGCVVLGLNGDFLAARNGDLRCMNDAHLAEALAVKEALSWVKDKGYAKIKLFSNCQSVCNLLNGSRTD